ncbi:MAG: DUF3592 domain-containing protein [Euryarchaeota archaeon]|nr:DUF3592 domain-containing protein [Euryarchaeota archaeon]MBT4156988.1 DUF3592 domain-containing protein [Euryarchaeota archaeon]MBT4475865.1 DUF3592 domain-containing protein [Euryarchaeota archaeon]MBT6075559.1 DUF3592 domain-containing protein [Euryarchaeota archaeon]
MNYLLYDILELIIPCSIMILLVVLFTGIRPRHIKETTQNIIKFIRDPPIIPYIGYKQIKLWLIGILVPFLVIILVIILISMSSIINQIETSDWVKTTAIVDFAEERQETTCDAEGNCTTDYWTHVEYDYEYEEVIYSGSRYTFLSKMSSGLSEDFPSGKEINIYVDDENPHESLMVNGWSGIWIEAMKVFWVMSVIFSILIVFLSIWKVSFHLQSTEKKQKAMLNPGESGLWNAGFMTGIREIVNFSKAIKSSQENVYQGEIKSLKFQIDGVEIEKNIKNINDILNVVMVARSSAIVYLEHSGKMGRNIEMEFDFTGDDDIVNVKELLGAELITEQEINLDLGPLELISIISEALKSSLSVDDAEWWM